MVGGAGCGPVGVIGGGGCVSIPALGGLVLLPTLRVAPVLGGGGPSPGANAPLAEAGGGHMQLSCAHNRIQVGSHSSGAHNRELSEWCLAMDAHVCMGASCAQGRSSTFNHSSKWRYVSRWDQLRYGGSMALCRTWTGSAAHTERSSCFAGGGRRAMFAGDG
jgi:hypothetical protein